MNARVGESGCGYGRTWIRIWKDMDTHMDLDMDKDNTVESSIEYARYLGGWSWP